MYFNKKIVLLLSLLLKLAEDNPWDVATFDIYRVYQLHSKSDLSNHRLYKQNWIACDISHLIIDIFTNCFNQIGFVKLLTIKNKIICDLSHFVFGIYYQLLTKLDLWNHRLYKPKLDNM
jgi:hypothetical protein